VYQSTDDTSYTLINTQTGSTLTVGSLNNGTQYFFKVSAVNSVGESDLSSSASATPAVPATAPGVPQSLSATAGDTEVALSWSAPSSDGGATVTGYKVYQQNTGDSSFAVVATPSGTAHTVTGLNNGTTYYFKVAAVNSVGTGNLTSAVSSTPAAPSTGITPNTDSSARFYLPAAQATFKVSCNTSTGYFKISSPGKTDVIQQIHTQYGTYYTVGGGASATMSGLSSSAVKTVTVSACTSGGSTSGNILGIDIGSDSTNNITGVDISGLTNLAVFNAGARGGSPSIGKFTGGPVGSRSMVSSIEEVRAVNISFTSANGYGTPYGPTTSYAYGGGFDLHNQDLDATALNQLYTDLNGGSGTGGVFVGQNPGTGSDNPSIASNYSIHGS
jgi:hypothetical protein